MLSNFFKTSLDKAVDEILDNLQGDINEIDKRLGTNFVMFRQQNTQMRRGKQFILRRENIELCRKIILRLKRHNLTFTEIKKNPNAISKFLKHEHFVLLEDVLDTYEPYIFGAALVIYFSRQNFWDIAFKLADVANDKKLTLLFFTILIEIALAVIGLNFNDIIVNDKARKVFNLSHSLQLAMEIYKKIIEYKVIENLNRTLIINLEYYALKLDQILINEEEVILQCFNQDEKDCVGIFFKICKFGDLDLMDKVRELFSSSYTNEQFFKKYCSIFNETVNTEKARERQEEERERLEIESFINSN